jgi:hypothetical protein
MCWSGTTAGHCGEESNGTAQTSVRKEVAMLDSRRALSLHFTSEGSVLSSAVLIPLFMLVVLVMS